MNKYTQMICVKGSRLRYHRRNSTNNNYSKMVSFYSQKKLLSYCEINSSLFNRSLILSVSFAYSFTHSLALSFFLQNKVTLYRQCKTSLWMKCALWYALHLSLSLSLQSFLSIAWIRGDQHESIWFASQLIMWDSFLSILISRENRK